MRISGNRFFIILVTIALFALNSSALARTLYVSPVGSDLNDGSSWMRAKRTVTAALEAARAGDEIWVRYGVYYERITLKDGVSLYGGFRGIERTLSERPPFPRPSPDPYETVLDGRQGGSVVATPSFAARNYRLDGFTVRNGKSDYGGGLYCAGQTASLLVVANCTFAGNSAESGGAIYCVNGASPTLTDCIIRNNTAELYGGGIFWDYFSYPTVTNCTIRQNTAGDSGGGVFGCASLTLTNCVISENRATNYGGGVNCYYYCSLTLNNCTINANTAKWGGGVYCDYFSSPTLNSCTVSQNAAYLTGGGLYCSGFACPVLTDCTIGSNVALEGGGAFCGDFSSPVLANCTISGNRVSYDGGGIYCHSSSLTLTDCNISRNTAPRSGGGAYCIDSTIAGGSISGNTAYLSGGGAYCIGSTMAGVNISGNTAYLSGGGAYCIDSTMVGVTISANTADYGGGAYCIDSTIAGGSISGNTAYYGGGIYCHQHSSLTLTDCIVSQNAAHRGGGLYCPDSSCPVLTNCVVSRNAAREGGGGVYCYRSSPTLTRCIISQNTAGDGGGGGLCCYGESTPVLTKCIVSRNTTHGNGAGIYCAESSSPVLTSCVISENIADRYGGGVCGLTALTLISCTIVYNRAGWGDGAITASRGGYVTNTLIALNNSGISYGSGRGTFRHNCVWGNARYNYSGMPDPTGTDGNISADPMIAGYHLLPGSPCIDAGDDSVIDSDSTDFDGEARIGGNRVDIGADEFHPPIVQGWMTFSDYVGTPPLWVPFEVRADSTTTQPVIIAPDGSFVVPGVPVGQFALSVKPLSYLRRTVEVDTTWGSVPGLRLELVNGDVDGDNEVTLFDFGRLVAAFGSAPGDANWDENADLDGDEEVTLFDFGILVRNFGEFGDD